MKYRCNNSKARDFILYGSRGIKVCEEWNEFLPFYTWAINNGYEDCLTIDRINNEDGYKPENCRWADIATQNSNKRNSILPVINGEKKTLAEWAIVANIKYETVKSRYRHGDRGERLIRKDREWRRKTV